MRLITSLTSLTATALFAAALSSCAGNAPRKPASTTDKSTSTSLNDTCREAEFRNAPPPVGCPQTTQTRRARTLPDIDRDAILVPTAPSAGLPGGGILGR